MVLHASDDGSFPDSCRPGRMPDGSVEPDSAVARRRRERPVYLQQRKDWRSLPLIAGSGKVSCASWRLLGLSARKTCWTCRQSRNSALGPSMRPRPTPSLPQGCIPTDYSTIEDVANKLRAAGVEPKLSPPAEVTALLEAEIEQWARIIKSAYIQIRE